MSSSKALTQSSDSVYIPTVAGTIGAFIITAGILVIARQKAPYPLLLADRLLNGLGWIEICLLAVYAAFISNRMSRGDSTKIRLKIWLLFSIVFFGQLILGLAGIEGFLMTGRLHVPVPAVVIGGPIFRGARFFMPILFLSTIILVGPAWCSHLCYIGGWDGLAASNKKRSSTLGPLWTKLRIATLVATPLVALLLRLLKVDGIVAGVVAISFGVFGIGIMTLLSTRRGVMVHCTAFCPLGLAGNILGKISPFRLRIKSSCTKCGLCVPQCRYNALDMVKISKRRPGFSCTLCGDCLGACRDNAIAFTFLGLNERNARALFLTLTISLHAVFLGVARI